MKTFTITDRASKGIVLVQGANFLGVPVGQGLQKEIEREWRQSGRQGEVPPGMLMLAHAVDHVAKCDETGQILEQRLVREAHPGDRRALVAVDTDPGIGGEIHLYSNLLREKWDERHRRVVRYALPLEEAVGVDLLSTVEGERKKFLLALEPGAGFRIVRTGKLAGPPELVVSWHGRWRPSDNPSDMVNWKLEVRASSTRHTES